MIFDSKGYGLIHMSSSDVRILILLCITAMYVVIQFTLLHFLNLSH